MIIYSVTVTIDENIQEDWFNWMKTKHIPDVMATGYFSESHIQVLLDPEPEKGTLTYNIQYSCESMEVYLTYQEKAAPALQEEHTARYRDRFAAFRTLLHRV